MENEWIIKCFLTSYYVQISQLWTVVDSRRKDGTPFAQKISLLKWKQLLRRLWALTTSAQSREQLLSRQLVLTPAAQSGSADATLCNLMPRAITESTVGLYVHCPVGLCWCNLMQPDLCRDSHIYPQPTASQNLCVEVASFALTRARLFLARLGGHQRRVRRYHRHSQKLGFFFLSNGVHQRR